jgi:transketolase
VINGQLPEGWAESVPQFPADPKGVATRTASGKILNAIAPKLPTLIGGSADLNPSTFTVLTKLGDFQSPERKFADGQGAAGGGWDYAGRNIHFGVREHGMGAALNGMAAHGGVIPYGSTFLIFSDYLRPSIQARGADGTGRHLCLYSRQHRRRRRRSDASTDRAIGGAPRHPASCRHSPGRRQRDRRGLASGDRKPGQSGGPGAQPPEACRRSTAVDLLRLKDVRKGAYMSWPMPPGGKPDLILIGTGSEVPLVIAASEQLAEHNIQARVVSMPSWELFEQQPQAYRETVLPRTVRARLAVEAGLPLGWHRYVGDGGDVLAIERFGASAPGNVVMEKFGFTK